MPISYSVLTEHLLIDLCCTRSAHAPSYSNCTAIPGHSWEQNGALSARSRQCHLVQSAYKILHLPAAKENGRDTDNIQEGTRSPATALWFEEKRLCLPDTWSCYRGGMLWGALWPPLLCVCINTTAVVMIIANTQVI